MRQRRWLELVKDYDYVINYHPGKANVVADALSRKSAVVGSEQQSSFAELSRMEIEVVSQETKAKLSALVL